MVLFVLQPPLIVYSICMVAIQHTGFPLATSLELWPILSYLYIQQANILRGTRNFLIYLILIFILNIIT